VLQCHHNSRLSKIAKIVTILLSCDEANIIEIGSWEKRGMGRHGWLEYYGIKFHHDNVSFGVGRMRACVQVYMCVLWMYGCVYVCAYVRGRRRKEKKRKEKKRKEK